VKSWCDARLAVETTGSGNGTARRQTGAGMRQGRHMRNRPVRFEIEGQGRNTPNRPPAATTGDGFQVVGSKRRTRVVSGTQDEARKAGRPQAIAKAGEANGQTLRWQPPRRLRHAQEMKAPTTRPTVTGTLEGAEEQGGYDRNRRRTSGVRRYAWATYRRSVLT
jgi:hypothetical protein